MKVAICFHGITRCLEKTLPGIQENLLEPLRSAGIDCSVYLHCLTMDVLVNERSGEHGCEVDAEEWAALCAPGPNALAEPQEEVDERLGHEQYQRQLDPWNDGFASMRNYVRALYSQGRVLELIPDPLSFDAILSARPDILYSTPFDPAWIRDGQREDTILVPEFGAFGGLNDRFAVGSPKAMIKYMLRGHEYKVLHLTGEAAAFQFTGKTGTSRLRPWYLPWSRRSKPRRSKLTGERYLAEWVKSQGIKVRRIPWTFARIRANGSIPENDKGYVARDR